MTAPIPLILNIHLQLLLFVYVAAVPLQLVKTLGWVSIPATSIAAAVFFGLDRASEELSDPFGTERESPRPYVSCTTSSTDIPHVQCRSQRPPCRSLLCGSSSRISRNDWTRRISRERVSTGNSDGSKGQEGAIVTVLYFSLYKFNNIVSCHSSLHSQTLPCGSYRILCAS